MNTIVANSCNELEKLLVKRVTKLFLTLAGVLPLLIKLLVNKLFITNWMAIPSDNINFSVLDIFINILLPLFCFIAATDLFSGEAERGTLFPVRPINRFELFLTKTAAICLMITFQLVLVWLSLSISDAFLGQFQFSVFMESLGLFLLSSIPLFVLTVLSILLSLVIRSSVLAVSSMIGLYLLMMFLPYVFPDVLYLLPSSYLDWYMQWLGNVSIRWLVQTVTYLCSSFTLFFTTGYYIFNKKEA